MLGFFPSEGGRSWGLREKVLPLNEAEGRWKGGPTWIAGPGAAVPMTPPHPHPSPCPGLAACRRGAGQGQGAAGTPLTFTFIRSSQKLRGGSTMVVLSSMT